MKIVGFWLVKNHVEERWRNFATIYTTFAILVAIVVEMRDLYFTWGDFSVSEKFNFVIVTWRIFFELTILRI